MRWVRRGLVVAGTLLMGYAMVGGLLDPDLRPVGVVVFLAGVLLAHDAVVLPLALAAGVLIGRFLPAGTRTAVRIGGLLTATLQVLAVPLVLGLGRRPDDPSALPRDYGWGLAALLLLVWTAVLASVLIARLSSARRPGGRSRHPRRPT